MVLVSFHMSVGSHLLLSQGTLLYKSISILSPFAILCMGPAIQLTFRLYSCQQYPFVRNEQKLLTRMNTLMQIVISFHQPGTQMLKPCIMCIHIPWNALLPLDLQCIRVLLLTSLMYCSVPHPAALLGLINYAALDLQDLSEQRTLWRKGHLTSSSGLR